MRPEFRIGINATRTETTFWAIDNYRGRLVVCHDTIERGALPPLNPVQWKAIVEIIAPARRNRQPTFYRVGARGAYRRIYGVPLQT